MRTVQVLYHQVMGIGSFSHTLDHVGEHMVTRNVDTFFKAWISLYAHSPKARLAWKTQTGLPSPSYSTTRWWSRYEVIAQVHNAFGDVHTFLLNPDLPHTTTRKMLEVFDNPGVCRKFKMELANDCGCYGAFCEEHIHFGRTSSLGSRGV